MAHIKADLNAAVLTWDVVPTGDSETGKRYAIEFLSSCDGSLGWMFLMPSIVSNMMGAGTDRWPDGAATRQRHSDGFMDVMGRALCAVASTFAEPSPSTKHLNTIVFAGPINDGSQADACEV